MLIETDADGAPAALERAADLRRRGTVFDVALHLPDDRATLAALAARDVCAREPDRARRAAAFAQLASHDARLGRAMLEDLSTISAERRAEARALLALARRVRVHSSMQFSRLVVGLDGVWRRDVVRPIDTFVPHGRVADRAEAAVQRDRIVLWAPQRETDTFLLAIAGACEAGAPVDAVCAGGDTFGYPVRIVSPAGGAAALARAEVIVAVDPDDCGAALALATWGRPLCAPTTSGADFWLRGVTTYRPWSAVDMRAAIEIARAGPTPRDAIFAVGDEAPPAEPEASREGPLVRVVVRGARATASAPTAAALAALAYAPLEIVTGPDAACAGGADAAYVYAIADGDAPYPESVARLVAALERTGADAAAGETLVTTVGAAGSSSAYRVEDTAPARLERGALASGVLARRVWLDDASAAATLVVRVDAVLAATYRARVS